MRHPLAGISPALLPRADRHSPVDVARWYVDRGLRVFPACAPKGDGCTGIGSLHAGEHKRGKVPMVKGWQGRLETDRHLGMWQRYGHNTALACGRAGDSYTVVLDFDGEEGKRTRARIEEALGPLPPTLMSTTGRGVHLLFAAPEGADASNLKGSVSGQRLNGSGLLEQGQETGFDLRAEGGYIIAPGSRHELGALYVASGAPIATLPDRWWMALPRSPSSLPLPSGNRVVSPAYLTSALRELDAIPPETEQSDTNDTLYKVTLRIARIALNFSPQDLASVEEQCIAAGVAKGHPETAVRSTVASAVRFARSEGPAAITDRPRERAAPTTTTTTTTTTTATTAGQKGGRPTIAVVPELHRMVDQAISAIGTHAEVYQRRGAGLTHILTAPAGSADPGAPVIEPIPRPVLAARLSEVTAWSVTDPKTKQQRAVRPPDPVVAAVHAWGVYPPSVRPLRGIVEAPTLRRDGSVITTPGYDPASGLYLHWSGTLELADAPTHDDAREAYRGIVSLFADFRFAGSDTAQAIARAAIVAAILTPLAREAIDGPCPAFVFEADRPNAGKTLAASVCGAIATGRIPAVRQHTADDDETAKRIAAIALAGHPVALFDNVRSHIEGGALEGALSAHSTIAARILGRTEDREVPWRTVLYLTMNQASFSEDMVKRVVHIAMVGRDDEEQTGWTIPELVAHAISRRIELLRASLTMLRAHQIAGRPRCGGTKPKFEAWSRVVASAICWASGCDPTQARPPEAANRDANVARAVALAWRAAYPRGEAMRVGSVLQSIRAASADRDPRAGAIGALRDALADLAGASDPNRLTPGSMGKLVASRVAGRLFVDPDDPAARVGLVVAGAERGSVLYAARVERDTPPPPPLPLGKEEEEPPMEGDPWDAPWR